jgi:CorA-like Mg2+ transporter protein
LPGSGSTSREEFDAVTGEFELHERAVKARTTSITGVYGMNFEYMPELLWPLGYPFALLLMAVCSGLLYLGFRRSGWL